MTEEILITEEQAETIRYYFKNYEDKTDRMSFLMHRTGLDLITLARIVEGESYGINYEFKVGDVIECSYIYKIVNGGMLPTYGNGVNAVGIEYVKLNKKIFKLVCKAENREDLKEATAE
jgi:hypothetical protein